MTLLLVLLAWTVCAAVVAPFVGRVLAHGGVVERRSRRPVHHRSLPTRRHPLVLH
jgi:UDP-N-acetylmuramyl pentapeptide phosphotransferase/UDP-N-acetylglucosamine-1-phosphate transferase